MHREVVETPLRLKMLGTSVGPGLGPFLSKYFLSKFPDIFSAQFFVLPYFKKNPNIGMRSLPNIFPSVKFLNF